MWKWSNLALRQLRWPSSSEARRAQIAEIWVSCCPPLPLMLEWRHPYSSLSKCGHAEHQQSHKRFWFLRDVAAGEEVPSERHPKACSAFSVAPWLWQMCISLKACYDDHVLPPRAPSDSLAFFPP